jgi:DNA-binding MarR family transcriptional regulator
VVTCSQAVNQAPQAGHPTSQPFQSPISCPAVPCGLSVGAVRPVVPMGFGGPLDRSVVTTCDPGEPKEASQDPQGYPDNRRALKVAMGGTRVPASYALPGKPGRTSHMSLRPSDIDMIVDKINKRKESEFFRDPDKPSTRFVQVRQRQDPKIRQAKARARTAAWRNGLDRLHRPEARDIGMALVTALVTSRDLMNMTEPEVRFVSAALADLESRGFDRKQTLRVLRRLRNRLLDPGDRQGEESESTGQPIMPSS